MYPRIIRVFIASPGDVQEERELVKKAITDLNAKFENIYGVILQSVSWDAFRPDVTESTDKDIQRPITSRLEKCYWFVGILYKRYGSTVGKKGTSGTHKEFRFALKNKDKIKILTYTRVASEATLEDIEQAYKLNMLKEEIKQAGVRYRQYKTPLEFDRMIVLDLMEALLEITSDLKRRELLTKFFKFGIRGDQREPSVLIGYPPIHKHWGPSQQHNYNWTERLLPNVIYDDFKTIQKLETALRVLTITDYGAITVPHPKLLDPPGNRIWLCLPRNEFAQGILGDLGDRVWFKFRTDVKTGSRFLIWQPPDRPPIHISSPLEKYLFLGRPNKETGWDPKFGYIIAKDYAILARFKYDTPAGETPFYHYFVAGIRGLGTWGVGWFVDNRFNDLAQIVECSPHEDIQIILEVIFKNFRIEKVSNVSDKEQSYFDLMNSDAFIQKDFQDYIKSNPLARINQPLLTTD